MVHHRTASIPAKIPWLTGCIALSLVLLTILFGSQGDSSLTVGDQEQVSQQNPSQLAAELSVGVPARFATKINRPSGPPRIELQQSDPQGRVGSVACSTCHSIREPDFANRTPKDLDQFHQNMQMAHGTLACYSCHHPGDADSLRLADTTAVKYADVMTLCAQCHGTQARDYKHGTHGGMNGYWDLSRGPRTKNNCIDCHDPHVPKFPSMKPTFKPRDRFLEPPGSHAEDSHQDTTLHEATHG